MKPITVEWIARAEEDFTAANMFARARKYELSDSACFHARQCTERYLKAKLHEAGWNTGRMNDLPGLLKQALQFEPTWESLSADLTTLNEFSEDYLYPGLSATKSQAQDALKRCRNVRKIIRQSFGLPV